MKAASAASGVKRAIMVSRSELIGPIATPKLATGPAIFEASSENACLGQASQCHVHDASEWVCARVLASYDLPDSLILENRSFSTTLVLQIVPGEALTC